MARTPKFGTPEFDQLGETLIEREKDAQRLETPETARHFGRARTEYIDALEQNLFTNPKLRYGQNPKLSNEDYGKYLKTLMAFNYDKQPEERYGYAKVRLADAAAALDKASTKLPAARRAVTGALGSLSRYPLLGEVAKAATTGTPSAVGAAMWSAPGAVGKGLDWSLARLNEGAARFATRMQEARDNAKARRLEAESARPWSQESSFHRVPELAASAAAAVGSMGAPVLGGLRQLAATWLSDGGKNYVPEPNTEKMFSRDALQVLSNAHAKTRTGNGINSNEAYGGLLDVWTGGPAILEAEYPTGNMTVKNGSLYDVADMNLEYQGGSQPYDRSLSPGARIWPATLNTFGNWFASAAGSADDPDVGKIHTYIPLDKLPPPKDVRQAAKGGDVASDADPAVSDKPPVEERGPSPEPSAPARIIINPKVFRDKRDGLCVAYNEAFRVIMEMNGFDPQAEPTEEQRKFFSDTAYADDERMLRRTILARICTFDDSVKNPTDEQLDEALEFLETVMEIGAPQSEEEQANVQRIHDMIAKVREAPRPEERPAGQAAEPIATEAPL